MAIFAKAVVVAVVFGASLSACQDAAKVHRTSDAAIGEGEETRGQGGAPGRGGAGTGGALGGAGGRVSAGGIDALSAVDVGRPPLLQVDAQSVSDPDVGIDRAPIDALGPSIPVDAPTFPPDMMAAIPDMPAPARPDAPLDVPGDLPEQVGGADAPPATFQDAVTADGSKDGVTTDVRDGMAGGTGGDAAGAGASDSQRSDVPPVDTAPPSPLIDDLEDCDVQTIKVDGRGNYWYSYKDPNGTVAMPVPFAASLGGSPISPGCSAHLSGSVVVVMMDKYGYAGMGFTMAPTQFYDSSRFKGISFWAKGACRRPRNGAEI